MTVNDLVTLYEYGSWANRNLFSAIAQLTPDQFVQHVAGSYGSVRNTLVHAMSAEWGWLDRCGGHARGPKLNPDDYPTSQSVSEQWNAIEGFIREFFTGLTDADLLRPIAWALPGGPPRSTPLGALLQHAALHGVHHRGQVAVLLRELGAVPGNYDFILYEVENRTSPSLT